MSGTGAHKGNLGANTEHALQRYSSGVVFVQSLLSVIAEASEDVDSEEFLASQADG